jgi:hypothetical protein
MLCLVAGGSYMFLAGGRGEGWGGCSFQRSAECDLVRARARGGGMRRWKGGRRRARGEGELGLLGAASPLPLSEAKGSRCRLRWLASAVVRSHPDQPRLGFPAISYF